MDTDDPLAYDDIAMPNAPTGAAPTHAPPGWLDGLNEAQQEAVESLDGPLLVLAGAGTGKTRVLTTRLANLIHRGRAKPYQLLCVTFTNKAAREMRARVSSLIGSSHEGMWLGTFHSLGVRILRRHAELVGLKSGFTILDSDDQIRLLKQILEAEGIDDKRWPARMLIHVIQRWKDKGLTPDRVNSGDAGEVANGRAIEIYKQYQERLMTLNAADFGDLLLHNLTIFTKHPDILKQYQNLFRYILVDEYQDTNVSQYLWLRLLAKEHKNICCVGDDDQSIYGWRGAEVGNILRFEKDFPGAKVIRLERNYRSTPNILAAASGLIAKNEGRLGKTLWTEDREGEPVRVRGVWDGEEEARQIGDEIESQQSKSVPLDQMAILVRAGFQTREFEERLITLGVPYRVVGGPRFYEREEMRDAIAYLRVVTQPADDLAFERIINKPARKIGKTTIQAIHGLQRITRDPMFYAAKQLISTEDLKPAARTALSRIMADFDRWQGMAAGVSHVELTETVLDESGYTAMWQESKKPEAPGKLENLKELLVGMEEFENLQEFLEHVSLVMENENRTDEPQLSIMTLHGAKGLEFDVVFLPGWEEGLFPSQRTMDENGMAGLEEERRLAYVGLTRARKKAFISFAANRRIHGQWTSSIPSRFVSELPEDQIEEDSDRGLYAGIGGGRAEDRAAYVSDGFGGGFSDNTNRFTDATPRRFGSMETYTSEGGGPGWKRLRKQGPSRSKAPVIEGHATVSHAPSHDFGEGERCFHQKFGPGTVMVVDGDHLTIEFDKAGTKKVVASFVQRS